MSEKMSKTEILTRAAAMIHTAADYLLATGAADPVEWGDAHEIAQELYTAARAAAEVEGKELTV